MVDPRGAPLPPLSIEVGDRVIASLLRAHADLPPGESALLDRRLVIALAARVGDVGIVEAAIDAARVGLKGHAGLDVTGPAVLRGAPTCAATLALVIALGLKGIVAAWRGVPPTDDARARTGEASSGIAAFGPVLEIDGLTLTRSLPIIAYLDETRARPALMPREPARRARLMAIAEILAREAAPPREAWERGPGAPPADRGANPTGAVIRQCMTRALMEAEALLDHPETGPFAHGEAPGLVDCCLAPRLASARRHGVDLAALPRLRAIDEACATLPAFARSRDGLVATNDKETNG